MDAVFAFASCMLAFYVTQTNSAGAWPTITATVWIWTFCNMALIVFLFSVFGLYKIVFQSVGAMEIIRLMLATFILCIINFLSAIFLRAQKSGVGISTIIFYVMTVSVVSCVTRYCQRIAKAFRCYISRRQQCDGPVRILPNVYQLATQVLSHRKGMA